jgi:DNA-binding CsgD family transcriptional regulator/PAS domain-containing protein
MKFFVHRAGEIAYIFRNWGRGAAMTDDPAGLTDRVVERIYACIDEPRAWRSVLHEVAVVTDSTAGVLEVRDNARTLLTTSLDRTEPGRPLGGAISAAAMAWLKTGHSLGIAQRAGDGRAIGGVFQNDRGHLGLVALFRPAAAERFGRQEMRALEALGPHLLRAGLCAHRLQLAELRRQTSESALDQLRFGCLLVDGAGRVLFANRAAAELVRASNGLCLVKDRLEATRPDERKQLAHLLSPAIAAERGAGAVLITRAHHRPPLRLLVIPLPLAPEVQGEVASAERTLIVLCDPEFQVAPSLAILRTLHGLTGAEARLAAALARGERLTQYAARSGVTLNTVRTHLKSAFAKTETNSQSDLVRLLVALSVAIAA